MKEDSRTPERRWFNRILAPFEAAGPKRQSEGGYWLIVLSIIGFVLVAYYLLGQKPSHPEPVTFSYFKEPVGAEMSVSQAAEKLSSGQFKQYSGGTETLDLGYMREGVWVLMSLRNPLTSTSERFVLQLRHTYINGSFTPVELNDNADGKKTVRLGESISFKDTVLPRSQGLNDIRHISFPINVSAGGDFHALVRLRAHVMSVPFLILPEKEFLSSIVWEMVIAASFFGGLMLLALYNLMVGLARRENEFIFYGLYISSISLMIVAINGSGHMFIWPDVLWLHYNSANLLTNLCCMTYLAFTMSLFRGDPLRGGEKNLWNGLLVFCGVGLVLQIIEGGFFASIQANLAVLATLGASLARAWRARAVYGRIANLFLISEGVLFLGATVYCVKMFGWLPSTPFTLNIVTLAATLEGILLSFVLSEKMRRTMNEREMALVHLAAAQQHLEASVRDKTLAQAARYTSHEVLNPVFAVRLKAERIRDEIILNGGEVAVRQIPAAQQVLQKVNEIFLLIDSIIHTIRAIRTLSSDGLGEDLSDVPVSSAFDDAMRMLEAKSLQVGCKIDSDFSDMAVVHARRTDVVQILMNLISNSLDALMQSPSAWIRVSSRVVSDARTGQSLVEISVADSGSGPHPDVRAKLFQAEVSTKDSAFGMGLGLAFCQKLVLRNRGEIGFDENSTITRFYFRLPAGAQHRRELPAPLAKAG